MVDSWVQLLVQIPLVGAVIYLVLEQGKQTTAERRELTDLWIEDSRNREAQWREFLKQRDEQLLSTLRDMKESHALSNAAVLKQLESTEARTEALTVEVRAMHIKFAQLEQTVVLSLEQSGTRRKTGALNPQVVKK
ncbi:MAG TPA: hypothetical protein PKH77_26100 [Anaerolineae bacterium]|nr:hypothetical protein [Anaerolineae bacterium]